jgi:zinc transport system permease protein
MTAWDLVTSDFMLYALAAGLGVAVGAGPLGCLVVWRRMAYFGDAMAHSALLGVALGWATDLPVLLTVAAVGLALAGFLTLFARQRQMAHDTLLGLFSHASLSAGLIVLALMGSSGLDLHAWLFGDILAVGAADLWLIWGGAATVGIGLAALWRPLLAATVNREMARAEAMPVGLAEAAFLLMMALVVAASIKVVGAVLTTSLLIMPAAAARPLARTPEGMAVGAAMAGCLAVAGGLAASLAWDAPAGPSIVATAATLFVGALMTGAVLRRRQRFKTP